MAHEDSAHFFYLIDQDGNRCIPRKVKANDGRYGYPIHPVGKGNDASAATYTEDDQMLVQQVVLHGKGVRCRATSGPRKGQQNTLALGRRAIRGYWLHPSRIDWIAGAAIRPENEGAGA
jgi:hypothetical protein